MNGLGNWIPTIVFSALVMLVLYRRARRLLFRQRVSLPRLVLRLVLIGTACAMLLVVSMARGFLPAVGLVVGAGVGVLGLTLTRFESVDGEVYYTPNTYVAVGVLSLFVGRLIYRVIRIAALGEVAASGFEAGHGPPFSAVRGSAMTLGIMFVLLGYYLSYYTAVLIRGRMEQTAATVRQDGS